MTPAHNVCITIISMLQIDAPPVENFWLRHWVRFGAWTRVGLRNHILGGARILPGEWAIFRAPHAMRPFVQILRLLVETVHTKHLKKSKPKSFIQYGSNACWIHTITLKYEYKLDNENIKIQLKVHRD